MLQMHAIFEGLTNLIWDLRVSLLYLFYDCSCQRVFLVIGFAVSCLLASRILRTIGVSMGLSV